MYVTICNQYNSVGIVLVDHLERLSNLMACNHHIRDIHAACLNDVFTPIRLFLANPDQ